MLRRWLTYPLARVRAIERRLGAVALLAAADELGLFAAAGRGGGGAVVLDRLEQVDEAMESSGGGDGSGSGSGSDNGGSGGASRRAGSVSPLCLRCLAPLVRALRSGGASHAGLETAAVTLQPQPRE